MLKFTRLSVKSFLIPRFKMWQKVNNLRCGKPQENRIKAVSTKPMQPITLPASFGEALNLSF